MRRYTLKSSLYLSLFVLLTLAAVVQAQFTYTTNSGTITITGYTGPGGDVNIPNTIGGLPVTSIGPSAFEGCRSLKTLTINSNVTSIGSSAFLNCDGLTNAMISASVVPDAAFMSCLSLTTVALLGQPNAIGGQAFRWCGKLTSIYIPDTVTEIGSFAFQDCSNLASVNIPAAAQLIDDAAFSGCSRLTSVTIPAGVLEIQEGAFMACGSLSTIAVDPANRFYASVDGVLFDKFQTTLVQCPGGKVGAYSISDGVTTIAIRAFVGCASLSAVTIPSSVSTIGEYGFSGCSNLTSFFFRGTPPEASANTFGDGVDGMDPATVFYLPGTPGWTSTYTNLPTAVWKPLILTPDALGLQGNRFGFTISWARGMGVVVEATTNLSALGWLPLASNTLTSDTLYFGDEQWINYPTRFYRIRSP